MKLLLDKGNRQKYNLYDEANVYCIKKRRYKKIKNFLKIYSVYSTSWVVERHKILKKKPFLRWSLALIIYFTYHLKGVWIREIIHCRNWKAPIYFFFLCQTQIIIIRLTIFFHKHISLGRISNSELSMYRIRLTPVVRKYRYKLTYFFIA